MFLIQNKKEHFLSQVQMKTRKKNKMHEKKKAFLYPKKKNLKKKQGLFIKRKAYRFPGSNVNFFSFCFVSFLLYSSSFLICK